MDCKISVPFYVVWKCLKYVLWLSCIGRGPKGFIRKLSMCHSLVSYFPLWHKIIKNSWKWKCAMLFLYLVGPNKFLNNSYRSCRFSENSSKRSQIFYYLLAFWIKFHHFKNICRELCFFARNCCDIYNRCLFSDQLTDLSISRVKAKFWLAEMNNSTWIVWRFSLSDDVDGLLRTQHLS